MTVAVMAAGEMVVAKAEEKVEAMVGVVMVVVATAVVATGVAMVAAATVVEMAAAATAEAMEAVVMVAAVMAVVARAPHRPQPPSIRKTHSRPKRQGRWRGRKR